MDNCCLKIVQVEPAEIIRRRSEPPPNGGLKSIDSKWGAVTPGPFIIYFGNNANDSYFSTHEPGHIIQLLILGKYYYPLVAIPSLVSATFFPEHHNNMPWEKSANQLWYWITGENHPRNPLYFKKK